MAMTLPFVGVSALAHAVHAAGEAGMACDEAPVALAADDRLADGFGGGDEGHATPMDSASANTLFATLGALQDFPLRIWRAEVSDRPYSDITSFSVSPRARMD
jgi:hypothetical protein